MKKLFVRDPKANVYHRPRSDSGFNNIELTQFNYIRFESEFMNYQLRDFLKMIMKTSSR